MTLNLTMPGTDELRPRITVFGVGGAGGNAVNNMIEKQLDGVDFVVANTDAQALSQSNAENRIQLGVKVTEGLGAGAKASIGAAAAEESIEQIVDHLAGAHMCFITAGMGGGTGTGAAPIIAQAARELGVLTVGVVTKPFQFEGAKRMRQADDGIETLQKMVDTLIIIPNQNLFRLANEKTTFTEAFSMADDVLYQGVKGVTDLMVRPGLINLDFADVRAVMDEMGKAMMGTGEASGEDRAIQAAEKAIANPLLDEISLRGAKGVLINITGAHDLTLFELDEAANRIREEVDPDANIIVGSTLDTNMDGMMRVSVVATGIDAAEKTEEVPLPRRKLSQPLKQPETVIEAVEEVAAPAPAPAPVAAQAVDRSFEENLAREVAAMETEETVQTAEEEPNFFDELDAYDAAHDQGDGGLFQDDELSDDGLPAPAYRPQAAPAETTSPDAFVAPRAPKAGTPSPEALARLQAAVNRAPRPAPAGTAGEAERPRFGINSLINRMTGHGEEGAQQTRRAAPPVATSRPAPTQAPARDVAQSPAQAPRAAAPERRVDPDQERIEIPAFLRRQAN